MFAVAIFNVGMWNSCAEMHVCVSVLHMQKVGMLAGGDALGFILCVKQACGAPDQCHGCFFSSGSSSYSRMGLCQSSPAWVPSDTPEYRQILLPSGNRDGS